MDYLSRVDEDVTFLEVTSCKPSVLLRFRWLNDSNIATVRRFVHGDCHILVSHAAVQFITTHASRKGSPCHDLDADRRPRLFIGGYPQRLISRSDHAFHFKCHWVVDGCILRRRRTQCIPIHSRGIELGSRYGTSYGLARNAIPCLTDGNMLPIRQKGVAMSLSLRLNQPQCLRIKNSHDDNDSSSVSVNRLL